MKLLPTVLILLGFALSGVCRALANAQALGAPMPEIFPAAWLSWYIGGPGFNQSWPWSADYWHLFGNHLRQLFHAAGVFSAAYLFGIEKIGWQKIWRLLLLCWAGYWLEGMLFKLLFHCWLLNDWSLGYFFQHFIF